MATDTETEMQAVNERLAIATLTAHVHAIRTLLAAVLDGAVASGLIERQRGMIGPSLLDALDALDLAGEFLAPTEPEPDLLQRRADAIYKADRAEDANRPC
jgi:hypothetical protein